MFGTLGFLQDHTATETPAQALARQAYQAAERADRQAKRDEADQAAAREEAAERRAFRFRALNVQPGAVLARAMQEQEEDFAYDACRAQMERIERRRESRRRAAADQAAQLEAATRASGEPAGIAAANELAARLRFEHMLSRAAATPRPAPPAARSRPVAAAGRMITRVCGSGLRGNHAPEWLSR